jgi:hypothetical protein
MDTTPKSPSNAVAHSFQNRAEVERSESCACFHCFARFAPSEIRLWTDSDDPSDEDPGALRPDTDTFRGATAICPRCGYDSVIGSASGYELSDDFLHLLHDHWHTTKQPG